MAAVSINTGPVDYRDQMKQVSRFKWRELFIKRQQYIHTEFEHGCECVIDWLAEAEEFHEELGYGSADEMLEKELEIPPDWVRMAAAVLEATGQNLSKSEVDQALAAQRSAQAALALEGTFAEAGRPAADNPDNIRVNASEGGTGAAYLAARLKKAGRDDLLEQIGPDKPYRSVRAAAIEAGIVKDVPTVRLTEPGKAAASILERMGAEWAHQLAEALIAETTQ
jgi:hypothetical protein